jgi:pyruvate/2-oxoacid:ferredoxin oxidoreductase alpha subunit
MAEAGGGHIHEYQCDHYTLTPPYPPVIQPPSPEQEVAALENYQKELKAEKADLEQEMDQIKSRIEEIKVKLEKEP